MKHLLQVFILSLIFSGTTFAATSLPPFQNLSKLSLVDINKTPDYPIELHHPQLYFKDTTLMYSFGAFKPGDITVSAGCSALQDFVELFKINEKLFATNNAKSVVILWRILIPTEDPAANNGARYLVISFGYNYEYQQGHVLLMVSDFNDIVIGEPLVSPFNALPTTINSNCLIHIQKLRDVKSISS